MTVKNWDEWASVGSIEVEAEYPEGWSDDDRYLRYVQPAIGTMGSGQTVTVWIPPTYVGNTLKLKLNLFWESYISKNGGNYQYILYIEPKENS